MNKSQSLHRIFISFLGLIVICLLLPTEAQARRGPTFSFERITFEDGLSQNSAATILQDRQGFMWFGTLDGLNRYDGYEFTVYQPDPANPAAISDKFITSIYEDKDGMIWVGTDQGGLNRFDPATETFTAYWADPDNSDSLSSNTTTAIMEDRSGALWVGTTNGLNKFDRATETFTHYFHRPGDPHSLSYDGITAIFEDSQGNLWVGTNDGLNKFDRTTETFTVYRHDPQEPNSLSHSVIRSIYEDRAGTLWIGTEGGGLNRLEPESGTFTAYSYQPHELHRLSSDTVLAIFEDRDGYLWLGTKNGLNRFDRATESFTAYFHEPGNPASLSGNIVLALYEDRSGVLWIGTQAGGISKLTPHAKAFTLYRHDPTDPQSLSTNFVWSVYEDRFGTLWIGTAAGLNRFDRATETFTHYQHNPADPASLSYDTVTYIYEDHLGTLWVATDGGLSTFDRDSETFTVYRHDPADPHSLSNDAVGAIYEDRSGVLWICTLGGLNRFDRDTKTFTAYRNDPADPGSLSESGVWALWEDRAGNLWVGTGGGGLNKFDRATETFSAYRHDPADPHSLSGDIVISIYEDQAGTLWVGTFEGGLNKFDPASQTFTAYTDRDGLPNNSIYGILEDETGQLWLSTIKGLSRFDPRTETFKNYDIRDGLQSNEFNVRAYFKNNDGLMFFGGIGGLTVFDPAQIKDNLQIPPVVITAFSKFNQPVLLESRQQATAINLSHRDYVFSFEFAALDYTNPAENQYAYKLEGFDKDWLQAGVRRFASYTNLDGGNYIFRVRASNNDGVWNEDGLAIPLNIASPPWKSWWAYGLYILGLAVIVLGYVRYRTQAQAQELARQRQLTERLQQVDALKNEFLAHTSHELRTPLNGIIGLSESLIDGATGPLSPRTIANLQMVVSSGRRLVSLVNNILDFSKLKHQDLILQRQPVDIYALTEVILTLCAPLTGQKPVQLSNTISPDVPLVDADENRVQQVLYNLVGNAIKFTESGSIEVSAQVTSSSSRLAGTEQEEKFLAISVTDTGIGIPADKLETIFASFEQADETTAQLYGGTGLGLAVSRQLVNLHGGRIWVESTVGLGSRFTFTLPLSRQPLTPGRADQPATAKLPAGPAGDLFQAPARNLKSAPYHVLVVDDDPVNLQVLANQLAVEGYTVHRALGGLEALADIQGGLLPDLVILDIMMPQVSGYEVCRILRQRFSLSDLPILILTAKNQVEDLVIALQLGANDYLLKPFNKRELQARVRTLVSLKQLNLSLRHEIEQRKQAQEDLRKANEELEFRVQARTAELVTANRQLAREVAERKQAEAELEQAVQDLDEFAHTVAHDLKAPVGVMVGYASLMEEDGDNSFSARERQDMLHNIIAMGQKVSDIIQALLLLATIPGQEIELQCLDMSLPVGEAQLRLAGLIEKHQAEILLPASWPAALGYEPWIEEVWANYLSNAIKYGGRPPCVALGATPQANGMVRFWVRDNGPGLSPEQQEQVFTPFKRFDRSQTEGHGLGLAIVRRIVEKLGGQVGVESNGHGCTFYFTLPGAERFELPAGLSMD